MRDCDDETLLVAYGQGDMRAARTLTLRLTPVA
ncbi:RNA polymerase sigma factor (plasmid) [Pseudosulfitobacter pseudonitzschiae]|uniref:RNA polymerase sigma factor n=1 Tax=Pseudosulfitobacter pseudonitzschiae TaxID=1402135 RepID=A0A221K8J8_9RHOB|nr:RNA polymerase sigma factor [Pseudosulfitobacter pseudonitzschiae]